MTFVSSMSPYGLIIHGGITIVKISSNLDSKSE
ncbi:unnamed protein product [Acanthoscelides obtectus]|uniref:Uncharacterized protein n=1 Tax=Acanthoscelides obtectus TaxID=200917 RepID=A0A9P0JZK0_ACAOB|nr:unnamed protein product [Acanthoscelides obtectus]CAK1648642.1 hypothetical protein AOBTE_LOCUS15798 [Acanthoscelides obtectus]